MSLLSASATWSIDHSERVKHLYLCLYLYCRIGILLYCCISVLSYYSLYLLLAIRLYIFFYIYISVSVSLCSTSIFSIGCAVNHHRHFFLTCKGMAAQADTKHQSMLSLSAKILQQTSTIRDWVFYKKSLPDCLAYCLIGLPSSKARKRLR